MSAMTTLMAAEFMDEPNESLRYLIIGGEKLTKKKKCNYQLVNQYGPTENTVVSTNYILPEELPHEVIPIGKPIHNVKAYILDTNQQLLPVGCVGELCVSGIGLSRGYLNQPDQAESPFIDHPFIAGEKLYRTGDLCKWLADGNIAYVSRLDDQVKVRGHRIEPMEVVTAIISHQKIVNCEVLVRSDQHGEKQLIAYFVAEDELSVQDIRSYLKGVIPEFMIPSHFVPLEAIPLTRNGKVDKAALPDHFEHGLRAAREYIAPRNETEQALVNIWENLLGTKGIGIEDNFFDIGGSSIKIVQLSKVIQEELKVDVNVAMLFKYSSIKDLVDFFNEQEEESEDSDFDNDDLVNELTKFNFDEYEEEV
ncbi:MAG: non-ribosomal peptide synthetase [Flavobacteriales bacterium]|nr:non-ribosomal peptide synthetase [Flavobacteriales bacterium]